MLALVVYVCAVLAQAGRQAAASVLFFASRVDGWVRCCFFFSSFFLFLFFLRFLVEFFFAFFFFAFFVSDLCSLFERGSGGD